MKKGFLFIFSISLTIFLKAMDIQVNFDVREGKIKNLNGVNNGPKCLKEIADCNLFLKHYNDGWNNGYNFGIKWVEIWNEPDLNIFWSGSPSEYFVLYAYAVNEIKNYNPNIKVGGPGLAGRINFLEGFLYYCQKNSIPLDFVSWHHYGSKEEKYNPASLKNWASFIRNLMNRYGFFNAQSHLTEFNRSLEKDQFYNNLNLTGAAWNASALIKLQANVDYAFRYRGDVHPLGLWWLQEVQWVVQESFVSLAQFNKYPNRCQIKGLLDISEESALAGCSNDEKDCILILADPYPFLNKVLFYLL